MEINEIGELTAWILGIARALILVAGGGVGIYKIVKGKADETPKDFYEGLIFIGAAGVLIVATFGVEAIFQ